MRGSSCRSEARPPLFAPIERISCRFELQLRTFNLLSLLLIYVSIGKGCVLNSLQCQLSGLDAMRISADERLRVGVELHRRHSSPDTVRVARRPAVVRSRHDRHWRQGLCVAGWRTSDRAPHGVHTEHALADPQQCDVRFVYLDFLRIGSCVEAAHPMCGSSHQPPGERGGLVSNCSITGLTVALLDKSLGSAPLFMASSVCLWHRTKKKENLTYVYGVTFKHHSNKHQHHITSQCEPSRLRSCLFARSERAAVAHVRPISFE